MKRKKKETRPVCERLSCMANHGFQCVALADNFFDGRECPFYKEAEDDEAGTDPIQEISKRRS